MENLKNILSRGLGPKREEGQKFYRFWIAREQSKDIVFLDDEDEVVSAYEHRVLTISGRVDYVMCLRSFGETRCPLCELGNKRYLVYYLNIIDLDGYRTRDGRIIKNVKMVMPLKTRAAQALRTYLDMWKRRDKDLRLKFLKVTVARLPLRDAPATGDRFENPQMLTDEEIKKLEKSGVDFTPIELEKVVKVFRTLDQLEDYIQNNIKGDTDDEVEDIDKPVDLPF